MNNGSDQGTWQYHKDIYEAARGVDAVVISTEGYVQ